MTEVSVGIRELKSRLSEYLRRVRAGEMVTITDHGHPIGHIVPIIQPLEDRLEVLAQTGVILWSGRKLSSIPPVARAHGDRTVADLLLEDRE
jgi:prevent-host-death family protein